MRDILDFISKHQVRLKWVLVGAAIALGLYISYEALAGILTLIFGPALVQDHKRVREERREALRGLERQAQEKDEQLDEVRELSEKNKEQAVSDKNQEVTDFIDGEWK